MGNGYGTSSECVREMMYKDQARQRLRSLLMAGAATAPASTADASYFEALRERVVKDAAQCANRLDN